MNNQCETKQINFYMNIEKNGCILNLLTIIKKI